MLKACSYCGGIHSVESKCPYKPQRQYKLRKDKHIAKFRGSVAWVKKRESIRKRDNFCCRLCIIKPAPNARQYNSTNLSVHHIEPIKSCWNKRLDDDNLITLCDYHHKLAEAGGIPKDDLYKAISVKLSPRG